MALVLTPGVWMTATEAAWGHSFRYWRQHESSDEGRLAKRGRRDPGRGPRPRSTAMTNHPDLMKSGSGSVDEQHGRGLFGVDGDHGEAEGSTAEATGIPYVRGKRRADSRRTRDTGVETDDKSL